MLESSVATSSNCVIEPPLQTLEEFLASVERRAYRTALLSTRKPADALDVVQDAMTQLVQYYRGHQSSEWPLLFQRILQNRIMDWHRQEARNKKWFWQSAAPIDDDAEDEINEIVDAHAENPAEILARASDISCVIKVLEILPLRQRQAFMLRAWEGFDVRKTAATMGCSEGSVKTHYFRAVQVLREHLSKSG